MAQRESFPASPITACRALAKPLPASVDQNWTCSPKATTSPKSLATVLFLSLKLERPLFLEGEAGVGKTEIAKVLRTRSDAS